jgi:hypothetical protein
MPETKPEQVAREGLNRIRDIAAQVDLRDYFAAKAMQALLSRVIGPDDGADYDECRHDHLGVLSERSYAVADAMLIARKAGH